MVIETKFNLNQDVLVLYLNEPRMGKIIEIDVKATLGLDCVYNSGTKNNEYNYSNEEDFEINYTIKFDGPLVTPVYKEEHIFLTKQEIADYIINK